jgi:putative transposase
MDRFSLDSIAPSNRNTKTWPTVDPDKIPDPEERKLVKSRIQAIELLLDGGLRSRIEESTNISSKMAMYWLQRCLQIHPDGRIYGFRALGSCVHIEPYRRTTEGHKKVVRKDGTIRLEATGAFQLLLTTYPDLVQLIDNYLFKLRKSWRSIDGDSTTVL